MNPKQGITDLSFSALQNYCIQEGFPQYRARQISEWVYKKGAHEWHDMHTLPRGIREHCDTTFNLYVLQEKGVHESKNHDSQKYVFRTYDDSYIETVLIRSARRCTVCLSTQIGCKYACQFCASGKGGFVRHLSRAEIIDQIRLIHKLTNEKITNIVFMGMGEPFDNYTNTLASIETLTSEWGFGFGERRITVSTVGLIPEIERFAHEGFDQIKLSISLHAASDEKRKQIMPIAKKYPLKKLIETLMRVRKNFKRDITFEYIVIKDFNDNIEDSKALSAIAKKLNAKVNLIGYNPIEDSILQSPPKKEIDRFRLYLDERGVRATIRYSAGNDITAACGQLRLINQ